MGYQNLKEFSPENPLGGELEPYDIERDKELENEEIN